MKKIQRRLAAIMFTDMVGYSAMMQRDESIAQRLRERHREVFKKYTEEHGGTILQYFGDGTLSIYPSAAAAVECAVSIQQDLKKDPAVPLRIGIHTGDISYGDEDAYGDGVNIAARIEAECLPGGVFISGKVYDDIKNHTWLKAVPLGKFQLKNIQDGLELYAISNRGITVPEAMGSQSTYEPVTANLSKVQPSGRKNKFLSGLLALLFGMFGIHRFYLGQRKLGIVYLAITLAVMFVIPGLDELVGLMAIVGFVDAVLLWSMQRESFHAKYSLPEMATAETITHENTTFNTPVKRKLDVQFEKYLDQALERYDKFDNAGAIDFLQKAAEIKNDDPEVHFLMACCYSAMQKAEQAILHLDAAVGFGMNNYDRILKSDDLAFLRSSPIFDAFVKNEYRLPKELPSPKQDLLQSELTGKPDLLEQLNKLRELRENGVLDEEEYERLKSAVAISNGRK